MRALRRAWQRLRGRGGLAPEPPDPPARLVVGLGNPGPKYVATRHNVGFRIVEGLAARHGASWRDDRPLEARTAAITLDGQRCLLVEPQTFMNRSGRSVEAALERWPGLDPASDLLVVYDDLDLPTGRIRLRPSGGAGGHRGIADILELLESRSLPRLRFGIGHPGSAQAVVDWVLTPFSEAEEAGVLPDALERAIDAVEATLREGVGHAMGRFNASP